MKFLVLSISLLLFPGLAGAATIRQAVNEGNRLFEEQKYDASIEKYSEAAEKDSESNIINFNLGTAYYKAGRYDRAMEHLQKSLLSEEEPLRQKAHYNLGNALYKHGILRENEDISQAIASLERALSQYERTLEIDPQDEDAKYNHAFVQEELKRLKQKQQRQQQKQQDQRDQQQKDQDQKSGEQKQQDQQQQQSEGQKQEPSGGQNDQDRSGEQQPQQQDQGQGRDEEDTSGEDRSTQGQKPREDQEPSGGEKSSQGQKGQEQTEGEERTPPSDGAAQMQSKGQLTRQEAQRILEQYQQTEEPQGLLQLFQGERDTRPVLKDW